MIISVSNTSSQQLLAAVNEATPVAIKPNETKIFDLASSKIDLALSPLVESYYKNGIYHLQLKTIYEIENIRPNDTFLLTREKIRFCGEASYDRFFVFHNNRPIQTKSFAVLGARRLTQTFPQRKVSNILFRDSFDALDISDILLLLFAPILAFFIKWRYVLLIIFSLWILRVLVSFIVNKISAKLFSSELSVGWNLEDLTFYCCPQTIAAYYSNSERKPYMGKVER